MTTQVLHTNYAGQRGALFWLALKTSALTVLTLGMYRFWMKTRLRRYYWSSIRLGGIPLEYTGTGVEKFMGFLVAVVVLAFYIGVFNLILMFFSYSVLNNSILAYVASFVGVIPIYFYAQYRARRYVLARTRWRGLRFGIDPGAWGYTWRAILHWLATILTLGLLLPRQMFWLEKYRTDRTWFGGAKFTQDGTWRILLKPAMHFYIGTALNILAAVGLYFDTAFAGLFAIAYPWWMFGLIHLQFRGFRVLTWHKRLGNDIALRATVSTWKMIGIYLLGSFLIYLILMAVFAIGAIIFAIIASAGGLSADFGASFNGSGPPDPAIIGLFALGYFSMFVLLGVLTQVFITFPMMRHYAESLSINNAHLLAEITQRPRDEFAEAEGFADALDIGAAI